MQRTRTASEAQGSRGERSLLRRLVLGTVLGLFAACGDPGEGQVSPDEEVGQTARKTLYCDRDYSELEENAPRPYNAVGYLNNGCTAFLVDSDHIVAASHCFANNTTGAWVTGNMRFYPNFHPDRVERDPYDVPRATVERAVVGSRVSYGMWDSMDWGIAKVGSWQDIDGVDLTPITLSPIVPTTEGTTLTNPSYTRHHFPYDDNDHVTWDNMEWDAACGVWAVESRPAPFVSGVRDRSGCNIRWSSGYRHEDCWLREVDDDLVIHNCDVAGGSSGSPILWPLFGTAWAIGVVHGPGHPGFNLPEGPTCTPYNRNGPMNNGPSVDRFREAPRFASNVAINRRPDNGYATAVYAVDSDRDIVVYRTREGTPAYNGEFTFWKSLGTPVHGGELSRIATCEYDGWRPEVFVTVDGEEIYSRKGNPDGSWQAWTRFDLPSYATGVRDLDASRGVNEKCELYAIAESPWGSTVLTRTRASSQSWDDWRAIFLGHYTRIAALKYDGTRYFAVVDSAGDLWRSQSATQYQWLPLVKLAKPSGVTAWVDADMTWDEHGRGFMVAIHTKTSSSLRFTPMYGSNAWSWRYFSTALWAPEANGTRPAPPLESITASRWMEDVGNTSSPVVFATGSAGNVYFIEYARVAGPPRWVLDWKSFYHEFIPYD